MDVTIAATQSWELLAQLATYRQRDELVRDLPALLEHIVDVLGRTLPCPWGLLVVIEGGAPRASAAWGLDAALQQQFVHHEEALPDNTLLLRLGVDHADDGYLLVPYGSDQTPPFDLGFGQAITAQISLLIDAQQHDQAERLAAALKQLAHIASTQPILEDLLDLTLTQLATLVPYDYAVILFPDDEQGRGGAFRKSPMSLQPARTRQQGQLLPLPPNNDALYRTIRTQSKSEVVTFFTSDIRATGADQPLTGVIRSATGNGLLIPLLISNESVGLLVIVSATANRYSTVERDVVHALADQAGHLIAASRRATEQHQRTRELFVLFENSQVIGSTTQIEPMLNRVLDNIALAMNADACAVGLIEVDAPTTLSIVASTGFDRDTDPIGQQFFLPDQPDLSVLLVNEMPQHTNNVANRSRNGQEPHDSLLQVLNHFGFTSGIVLSMRTQERLIGVIAIGYDEPNRTFNRAELNLISTLTNQVTNAVVNAQLAAADHRRTIELEQLQMVSQQLSADLSLEDTLNALAEGANKLVPHCQVQVYLYNEEDYLFQRMYPLPTKQALAQGRVYPEEGLLTNWLGRHRRMLSLPDVQEHTPVLLVNSVLPDGAPMRAYLGLPLQVGNDLVGTIELMSDRPSAFSQRDERLMSILAGQAARAIRNALRYEQADEHLRWRIQQLTALQRVNSQLTMGHFLSDILEFVLEQALKATTATHSYIALYNTMVIGEAVLDDGDYHVIAAKGYAPAIQMRLLNQPLPTDARTAHAALANSQPELTDDASAEEQSSITSSVDIRSVLAVPIFYEAQVVGVVTLLSPIVRGFDHDAQEFVRALASQAALALGNAQRYEDQVRLNTMLQRRATMLNNVLEIGQALRADRSLEEVLEQIGESVIEATSFRRVVFYLAEDENPDLLLTVAGAGVPLHDLDRYRQIALPVDMVMRCLDIRFHIGRSFFIPAEELSKIVEDYPSLTPSTDPERGEAVYSIEDVIIVPLYTPYNRRLVGMMLINNLPEAQPPTVRAVEPLAIFADQAAIAIENVQLVSSARDQADQMRALFQAGTAVASTLNLDLLLTKIYEQIVEYLGQPSACAIVSYDTERDLLKARDLPISDAPTMPVREQPYGGMIDWVIVHGESLLVRDLRTEGPYLEAQGIAVTEAMVHRSLMAVPLYSQSRIIGVLFVAHNAPKHYTQRDVTFLNVLGNILAVALENVALFQERDQRIAELAVINRIGTIASSTLDLEQMLPQVYAVLAEFLPIDAFYTLIHRTGRTNTMLWMMVDEGVQSVWHQDSVPAPSSLSGHIISTGQPLLFRNLAEEARPAGIVPIPYGNIARRSASWLGVPLLVGDLSSTSGHGEVLGVIAVQSYTPDLYGARELSFLTTVASQLSLSAQNALLFSREQEQVEQLDLINRVSSVAAATLAPEQIYQAAVEAMVRATDVDRAELIVYDRPTATATIVTQYGAHDQQADLTFSLLHDPAVQWIDENQRPLIAFDALEEPLLVRLHGLLRRADIKTLILVPLIAGGEVIGLISLDCLGRTRTFSEATIELCRTIANQAAGAIKNAWLFTETQANAGAFQRKVDELSTLLDAARLLSSSLRPDEVLNYLMELVSRQLHVHTVALWTITSNGMLTPSAMDGIPPEAARLMSVPVGKGMTGQVASTSSPLIVVDVEEDGQSLYPDFQRRNRLTSFMGVPVIYRERTIGVLSVMTIERREFGADEMLLLAGLADQAAIALENARLFEQRERRINELTTFNQIGTAINTAIELFDLLQALHTGIDAVLNTDTLFIGLYEPLPQQVTFPIARIAGVDQHDVDPLLLDNPNSFTARVVLGMGPLLLRTPAEIATVCPDPPDHGLAEIGTYLGVPITTGSDVLGIIVLQSPEAYAFDADDERFLVTVASQAATAIAKAYILGDRERRLKEVTALKDIGSALTGTLDPQQMLEQLHRELGHVLNMSISLISLYDSESNLLSFPVAYDQGLRISLPPEPLIDDLYGWVIHNQAPLLIESFELGTQMGFDMRDMRNRMASTDMVVESLMIMPIISGDAVLGLVHLQSYEQRAFDADDLRFVSTATNQAAVALANAQLFGERGRRIEELATFNEIGQALSATVSFEELPDLIYRQTSRLLKTTNFYMALLDERNAQITFPLYIERGVHQDVPPLRDGTSLTEYIVRKREPLLLQGSQVPEQMEQLGIIPVGDLTRSWLGVPMISADKVIGVIGVQDYNDPNAYRHEDVRLLATIASWAGIALDNARLFQNELTRRSLADMLRDVAQSFTTTLALDEIQTLTINQLARVVPFDAAAVMLREEGALRVTAGKGLPADMVANPPVFEIEINQFFRQLADKRLPIIISDTEHAEEYSEFRNLRTADGLIVRCFIGAPLLVDDELVGALIVASAMPGIYTAEEAQLVFVLASQASQAIQNARLFERITNIAAELEETNTDLERRVIERTADLEAEKERLEAIHAITLELTSTLDMEEILVKALKMVCDTVAAARGSVMLRDPQNGELVCRAVMYDGGAVHAERLPMSFGISGGLAGWVMEHQELVSISDVRHDPRWIIEQGRADDVRSVVAVPLMSNDTPLGVLVLNSPNMNFFSEPQVKMLATIANEIAIAVHNAELYGVINDFASRMGESLMQQREESSKNRAILQSVTEGVIVLDEDNNIVLFNPAAELILGIPAEAVRDKPFTNLAMQGRKPQARKRASLLYSGLHTGLAAAKNRKGIYSIALELPDPTQTISVNLAPVFGNDGRRYGDVAVLRDVTREIEAERTKRAFISGVSHELRTPLTAIRGFVDLLLNGMQGPLTEDQNYSLGVVKTNSNRLMDLINDILTISSIESGKIELQMGQVHPSVIIHDVLQSLKLEAERKHLHVSVAIASNLPDITADKRRLTQVVFNLFSNAVKYTFEGGSIAVRAFLNPAGLMQIEVEDTGVGMSPDQIEKLFRPFYRADNPLREEAGGTGLGLSIAKSLVEEHGGELWPTSELGKGSTFHFVIPVTQPESTSADRIPSERNTS